MAIYYFVSLLSQVGIYMVLGISFNLALGFTGIINLGHLSFFAMGAYATAIAYVHLGVPALLAMVIGGMLSGVVSLMLMYACRNLKGDYLALGTLSFHFVVYSLLLNLETLTGGTRGMIIKRPDWLNNELVFLGLVAVLTVGFVGGAYRVVRSPFGTLLGAVRDDEKLIRSMGKNSQLIKIKALALSAFMAGFIGGVLAFFLRYLHPDFFFIYELMAILTIVIMGGLASFRGTIVASFIVVLLPELLRFVNLPSSIVAPTRQILYSAILLGILLINSRGLFGKVDLH